MYDNGIIAETKVSFLFNKRNLRTASPCNLDKLLCLKQQNNQLGNLKFNIPIFISLRFRCLNRNTKIMPRQRESHRCKLTLHRRENFIPVLNLATVSCKRGTTIRYPGSQAQVRILAFFFSFGSQIAIGALKCMRQVPVRPTHALSRAGEHMVDYEQSLFFLRDSRESETQARVKITPREKGETPRLAFLAWKLQKLQN